MRKIEIGELCRIDADFRNLEIFPESWSKQKNFFLYENTPRPCCALFFVCTDIRVRFCPKDGKSVAATRGAVVFIPRDICYHVYVDGGTRSGIETYTVNFNMLDEVGEELILSDQITLLTEDPDNLFAVRAERLCEAIHHVEGTAGEEGHNFLKIKASFYSLLDAVTASVREHSDVYYPIRIGAEALRNEWNRNEKIETYAAMCGISEAYFYQCFRRWSGKSPVEYRNLLRLSNAETMLRYTDMRVNEISEVIGFDDPFYFCRIFTKHFGVSPQKYRKAFRMGGGSEL